MLHFDNVYQGKTSIKALSLNSDKMIFAIITKEQTFIRYVANDGSSMILYSFDRQAYFVNGSVSSDFRLIHLTEKISRDGQIKYISKVYDIQKSNVTSNEIESECLINGDIKQDKTYNIILNINNNINEYLISFHNDTIVLSKIRKGCSMKHVLWSYYSQIRNSLSIIKKVGEKIYFIYDVSNDGTHFHLKNMEPIHPFFGFHFFCARYHKTFILIQQLYHNESGNSSMIITFFPQKTQELIIIPNVSADITINFLQFYSAIFAFVPNRYICVIDMKDPKVCILNKSFIEMPTSFMISAFENGNICDEKEGIVYLPRINLSIFKNPSELKEIEALSILGARVQNWDCFYCETPETITHEPKRRKRSKREYKVKCSSTQISLRFKGNPLTHHQVIFKNFEGNLMDLLKKHEGKENIIINKIYIRKRLKSSVNLPKIDFDFALHANSPIGKDDFSLLASHSSSLLHHESDNKIKDMKITNQISLNSPVSRTQSYDTNFNVSNSVKEHHHTSHHKKMLDKVVVNKFVVITIFDYLHTPYQIFEFIQQFVRMNGSGGCDIPIPYTSMYSKLPYEFYLKIPKETKKELLKIEDFFPSSSLMSRCQVFAACVRTLMEKRYVLSINEAVKRSMDIIRRQNSFVLNLRDAISIWSCNDKLQKFLILFTLYSELSFMNMPQVSKLHHEIQNYIKVFLPRSIREILMVVGIYCSHSFGLNGKAVEYWIKRIDPNNISTPVKPSFFGKKPKVNLDVKTHQILYSRDPQRKVFRYSELGQ